MSRWRTAFEDHAIHEKLKNLKRLLTEKEFKAIDSEIEPEIARIQKFINLLEAVLSNADPEYVTNASLDVFLNTLNTTETQLKQFKSNSNISNLNAANNSFDQNWINTLATVTAIASPDTPLEESAIQSLLLRGERFLEEMGHKQVALEKQIEELTATSKQLQTKVQTLEKQIEVKTTELNQLSTDWTTQFNTSQTDQETRFTTKLTSIEEDATTKTQKIIENLKTATTDKQTTYNNDIEEILIDVKSRHEKIKGLHGLVANDSTTAGYTKSADDETEAANLWRKIAVFFASLAVLMTKQKLQIYGVKLQYFLHLWLFSG